MLRICERFGISPFGRSSWDAHTPGEQAMLRAYDAIASQRDALLEAPQ